MPSAPSLRRPSPLLRLQAGGPGYGDPALTGCDWTCWRMGVTFCLLHQACLLQEDTHMFLFSQEVSSVCDCHLFLGLITPCSRNGLGTRPPSGAGRTEELQTPQGHLSTEGGRDVFSPGPPQSSQAMKRESHEDSMQVFITTDCKASRNHAVLLRSENC